MSRSLINFLLDVLLLLTFLTLLATQFVVQFAFPAGTKSAGWTLGGLGYDQWSRFSFGCLAGFSLGVLLHVMLHWNWVCGFVTARVAKARRRPVVLNDGAKTLLGVGLFSLLLFILLGLLFLAQVRIAPPSSGHGPIPSELPG